MDTTRLKQYLSDTLDSCEMSVKSSSRVGALPDQNLIVLSEMNLEQLSREETLIDGDVTRKVIECNFGDINGLRNAFADAVQDEVQWVICGLAFATYDFRVFGFRADAPPFCVTPIMSICAEFPGCECSPQDCVLSQFDGINWGIIEARLRCLQKPLDLFVSSGSCADSLERGCGEKSN